MSAPSADTDQVREKWSKQTSMTEETHPEAAAFVPGSVRQEEGSYDNSVGLCVWSYTSSSSNQTFSELIL